MQVPHWVYSKKGCISAKRYAEVEQLTMMYSRTSSNTLHCANPHESLKCYLVLLRPTFKQQIVVKL